MSDTILIRGFTASDPALSTLPNGVPVVNFRLVHRESLPPPRPEHCHLH